MSLNRGKQRKRVRRKLAADAAATSVLQPATEPSKAKPAPRPRKTLSERSPIFTGFLTLMCVLGAIYFLILGDNPLWTFAWLVLAGIEGFITWRIIVARGGWR